VNIVATARDGDEDPKSLSDDRSCRGDDISDAVENVGADPVLFSKFLLNNFST